MIKSKTSVLDVNDIFFNRLTNSANISTTGAGDLLAAREKPPLQHFNFLQATHYGVPSRAFQLRIEQTGYPDDDQGEQSPSNRLIASMLLF